MTQQAFQDYYEDVTSYCYGCGRLNQAGLQIKTVWDGDESVTVYLAEITAHRYPRLCLWRLDSLPD